MNHMEQVAKMLDVKLEERFKLSNYDEEFYINDSGLNCTDHGFEYDEDSVLREILCGEEEIVKLPWKPECDEMFWYITKQPGEDHYSVYNSIWRDSGYNYELYTIGNCFKTKIKAANYIPWYKENIERIKRGEKWRAEK